MRLLVLWGFGSDPGRVSRPTRLVARVGGLVWRTKASVRGTNEGRPPRRHPWRPDGTESLGFRLGPITCGDDFDPQMGAGGARC